MRGWLTCLPECALTLKMRGAKGESPWIDSSNFLGDLGKGVGENAGDTIQLFSISPLLAFILSAPVLPGPGIQRWALEMGITPKQETVTIPLNFYARIPKGLIGNSECCYVA